MSLKKISVSIVLLVLLAGVFAPVGAQDDMTHTCDAGTIMLLLVAEYDYGYTTDEMDLSTFEKGQYAELFDSMMSMMDEGEMMDEGDDEMMDEGDDEMMDEGDGEMMDEDDGEMMDEGSDEMMAELPTAIEGEDEACTQLRADLLHFFEEKFGGDMMMDDEG